MTEKKSGMDVVLTAWTLTVRAKIVKIYLEDKDLYGVNSA